MFASVAREYKWPPDVLGGLFFDDWDYEGLIFWFDDILLMDRKMKEKLKSKK